MKAVDGASKLPESLLRKDYYYYGVLRRSFVLDTILGWMHMENTLKQSN